MSRDNHDLTAGQARRARRRGAPRAVRRTEETLGRGAHLTHAQRVEHVNAYLDSAANKGIWSAIE